ncbi:YdcF family protein [Patescibacteria group bacterium]|nr:YdcF family protein [Patescibacteria group bacterium]
MNWEEVDKLASRVWDYLLMHQPIEKADVIIVFGSYNPAVADRAAELYHAGYAPLIVFTGGQSDSTTGWNKSEAETFADRALWHGVPPDKVLLETRSSNSGENIRFTKELLEREKIQVKRIIGVQKPYMERRLYATLRKQWPQVAAVVTSPQLSYQEYMESSPLGKARSISIMLGDIARLSAYADKGYQIPQEIPAEVWQAYKSLETLGLATSAPE